MNSFADTVDITTLTADKLPLYTVESLRHSGEWETFTANPFLTQKDAEKHIRFILDSYTNIEETMLRVGSYTTEMWRNDLIEMIMTNKEATQHALSILDDISLLGVLGWCH